MPYFVEVEITYLWLTLRSGTPLISYGPVTRRSPEGSYDRNTTLFPLKRPINNG